MDCAKCARFIPGKYSHTGSCMKYIAYRGRGKLVYQFADDVRKDTKKCGPDAVYFVAREKNASSQRQDSLWKRLEQEDAE